MRHVRNLAFVVLCLSAAYAHGATLQAFDCTEVPGPVGLGTTEQDAVDGCEDNAEMNCDSYCYNNACGAYTDQYDCSNTWEDGGIWTALGVCGCEPWG